MTGEKTLLGAQTGNQVVAGTDGGIRRLSVIICTFNRMHTLRLTLSHLLKCNVPESCEVEIIMVDNNSSDGTKGVVEACALDASIPIKYVLEAIPGVGNALNKGIAFAQGDVLCLLDDDSIPDKDFLVSVKREFESRHYTGIMGGRVELWNQADLPITIKTDRDEQRLTFDRHPVGFMHGCNMVVHRAVFRTIGGFDRRLGPGSFVGSGSDLDFYYRALGHGVEVIYCPQILVFHNHGRKTQQQAKDLMTRYQIGRGAFYAKHMLAGDARAWRYTYWEYYKGLRTFIGSLLSWKAAKAELCTLINYSRGILRFVRARRASGSQPEAINT